MKNIKSILLLGLVYLGVSCNKNLDINTNPNQAVSSTPQLLLPQALAATASLLNNMNSYGAEVVGYSVNAGGYGGFGTSISYNYQQSDWNGLWTNAGNGAYDNMYDYQAIINMGQGDNTFSYFTAVAQIMKAHDFELMVDTYNSIPYSEALKGAANLQPKYDDPKVIYKDLADKLDAAIALIHSGSLVTGIKPLGTSDVVFAGNTTKWIQLANTIKLRLIVRAYGKMSFTNTTFDPAGFLTTDALINPGYTRDNGKQNPKWTNWGFNFDGSDGNKAWMPSKFIITFYNGAKIADPGRGYATYYQWPTTAANQLGIEVSSPPVAPCPSGSFWYPSTNRDGKSAGSTTGALKGPNAGFPIITAAESYFLQAEACLNEVIPGSTSANYYNGIKASFNYLYQLPDGTISGDPVTDEATYEASNSASPLVNFSLDLTTASALEAIITQKYIALNFVNGNEAWNEYRRTHYPTISNAPNAPGTQTIASTVSQSTRPDRLPTRVLYPVSESSYNTANVPTGISVFSSLIFWAL